MQTVMTMAPAAAHTLEGHPEHAGRMVAISELLQARGILDDVDLLSPTHASVDQLLRVHDLSVVEHVRQTSLRGGGRLDADTYATTDSYELGRLAAGACCDAVAAIMTGKATNGMALVRPPGHHAEIDRSMGFCLFNNIAVAAREAQEVHGVDRVMIIDFDVHHGNGTQDIFYADPSVLFVSTHLYTGYFYPGTGRGNETGRSTAKGSTLNVPLPPYFGDTGYETILRELIMPKAAAFQPELILVSAGYDAHWRDPLASAGLSLTGYAAISQLLVEMANQLCDGKILFVLEGGYLLDALAYGVLNSAYSLLGRDAVEDPLGAMDGREADITEVLQQLRTLHLI